MSSTTVSSASPGPAPGERDQRTPAIRERPVVEIVVPVHNEQRALPASIRRLHEHLSDSFPFRWRIVIANNASTDETARVAAALADDLPGVERLDLAEKGRGRALRTAWMRSDAEIVAYMDVDLSTDLRALLPLVAPLVSGHSDIAIGTRLASGSRVVRGPKREFISRSYNRLLHLSLAARFSDAQCGFKAIRADAARRLLPEVRDQAWFFDTELLVLAQREGLRIHEVPVDWTDDPDSRVDLARTARDDLRGIVRLLASARLTRFLAIGVLSTVAYALLYLLLRSGAVGLSAVAANVVALAVTAVANTQANRRFSFRVRGREDLVRHHAMGGAVFVLTLLLTSGSLAVLHLIDPSPAAGLELAVLVVAGFAATVSRYVALRSWVFVRRGRIDGSRRALPGPEPRTVAPADRLGG
jgi:glycosyltransferase involved in cell wall biosynthesis